MIQCNSERIRHGYLDSGLQIAPRAYDLLCAASMELQIRSQIWQHGVRDRAIVHKCYRSPEREVVIICSMAGLINFSVRPLRFAQWLEP